MGDYQDYNEAVQVIKAAILRSQYVAAANTNAIQLGLYYGIGRYVSSKVSCGAWGQGSLKAVSAQLQKELPGLRGFSERNLYYMKTFYEEWSPVFERDFNSALANAELPSGGLLRDQLAEMRGFPSEEFLSLGFTHHRQILSSVKDYEERIFYIRRCANEHYGVEALKRAIRNDEYRHRGTMANNFAETILEPQRALRAIETFKDEYLLDFINVEELGVRDTGDIDERAIEQAIAHNVKNFIMEFGRGFSFVGNSFHLNAFGEDQFIDLLFFNRNLNCLVAVELKRGAFKPAYLGQLSGYLSILDKFERKPHEAPSIGIVLCKDMNEAFVNLVIRNFGSPMGVATYSTSEEMPADLRDALPDIGDLRSMLERTNEGM